MKKILLSIGFMVVLFSSSAFAKGWSFNFGYHNPPGATVGANFMHIWEHLALELGIGWLDLKSSQRTGNSNNGSNGSSSLGVAGDINLKYLFLNRVFRPYIQGGFSLDSVSSVGDNTGAAAGVGGGFFGGGFFLMGQKIYAYGSINSAGGVNTFLQGGIGFNF